MLNDPRFPNRPQHPDFWSLVDVTNQLDGRATEGNMELDEILSDLVDINVESVVYMATQKARQAAQIFGLSKAEEVYLTTVFLNGFAVGVLYERKKHDG